MSHNLDSIFVPRGMTARFRDLVLMGIDDQMVACIACDSSGGFGEKVHDTRYADGVEVGYSVAKVPLMEMLAVGARPVVLIDNLCVEMNPTGLPVIEGIRRACRETGYDIEISGSDETNIPTTQTGVGTTVIGLLERSACRLGASCPGDVLVSVGLPLGGSPESATYREGDPDVAGIGTVLTMLAEPGVREILPVGSRGIAYEAGELARSAGLHNLMDPACGVDLDRSAGASTAILCSVAPKDVESLLAGVQSARVVGSLVDLLTL